MSKLWNGKVKRIEVFKKAPKPGFKPERLAIFNADDVISSSPRNIFYLNGEEVYWYDERQCFHRVAEV